MVVVFVVAGAAGWWMATRPKPLDLAGSFTVKLTLGGGYPPDMNEVVVSSDGSITASVGDEHPSTRLQPGELAELRAVLDRDDLGSLDSYYGEQVADGMYLRLVVATPAETKSIEVEGEPSAMPSEVSEVTRLLQLFAARHDLAAR